MLTIDPKEVKTSYLHGMMLGAVSPRPIAFASTIDASGNVNLSPYSFFNVFSSNPPLAIFSPARRVRDNSIKHTLMNAQETGEVVINVVNYDIVQQMSLSSTEYAAGVNEFEKAGLTMLDSDVVKPPRVAESPAQFECTVREVISLGDHGGAGNLILCEIVRMHVSEEVLDDDGKIDQHKIDLVARMGGNWYSRANMGMFEVEKPLATLGMGIDQMPESIRNSSVLTGNDLGMLGNVEQFPANEDIIETRKTIKSRFLTTPEIHTLAQEKLRDGQATEAWKILLSKVEKWK